MFDLTEEQRAIEGGVRAVCADWRLFSAIWRRPCWPSDSYCWATTKRVRDEWRTGRYGDRRGRGGSDGGRAIAQEAARHAQTVSPHAIATRRRLVALDGGRAVIAP
jgi:hypothetical protein